MIAAASAARMFQAAAAHTAAAAVRSERDILFYKHKKRSHLLVAPFFAEKCNYFNIYYDL